MYAELLGEFIEDFFLEKIENDILCSIVTDYVGITIFFAGIFIGLLTVASMILGVVAMIYGHILGGVVILLTLPALLATFSYYTFGAGCYLLNL